MYSKEGIKLTILCETADWVWTVRSRPKHDYIVVGCNDGSISMLQLVFSTVCRGVFASVVDCGKFTSCNM